jgi:hypothetical protein
MRKREKIIINAEACILRVTFRGTFLYSTARRLPVENLQTFILYDREF